MKIKTCFILSFLFAFLSLSAQDNPVKMKVESKKVSACEYDIVFKAVIEEGWHMYSSKISGDDGPNPTKVYFNKSKDFETAGKLKETAPVEEMDKVFGVKVAYFKHNATFTQRIKLKSASIAKVSGKYEFQACTDEKCIFPPADDFTVDLTGSSECAGNTAANLPLEGMGKSSDSLTSNKNCICDTQAILTGSANKEEAPAAQTSVASAIDEKADAKSTADTTCHPWEKFLLGLLAGLGAVLMPCIYSLIPLTVSFFVKRSGSRAAGIRNSMLYGFFIIITFVIPTMLITVIFGPDTLSKIATNTWLNIFFFALFVIFALSFFGLFEITLPASWGNKLDAQADKGGVLGIFFMAATLVVVSFSCTAGFLGPLLTTLAEGSSYLCPLAGFTGFGAGIALPFMLFAFFPSMLTALPKSGGWMNTFKVSVAFIELALAVKFLANADNVNEWGIMTREVFISLWIGIFAMMTFYLIGLFKTSHDDDSKGISTGRMIFATISLSFTMYLIPGLWGAPLKLISSFPPPHHYAESPDGFGGSTSSNNNTTVINSNPELAVLEAMRVSGPDGLKVFKNDYDNALKYARLVHKPLFIDFTGNACVNCRLMENNIWVKPSVLPLLKENVVIVSLYVDNKVDLPEAEKKEVFWYGKNRTLSSVGDKWAYLQTTKYKASSQPMYVVLDDNEQTISKGTMGTELDEKVFHDWLAAAVGK